jgi:hypothetical protein
MGGFVELFTRASGALSDKPSVVTPANPLPVTNAPVTASTSNLYGSATTITRAANTTQYTANDTVGGVVDLGVMGPAAGRVLLQSVSLDIRVASVPITNTMANMRLALYSATPPSAVADNGAWTWAVADEAERLTVFSIGTPEDVGAGLYVERNNIGRVVELAGTHLFAYLITDVGFTPAAASEVYVLTLHTVAL